MDALSIVHDEVALEGLDGITIPSLWIRLRNRSPSFPLKLDTYTKEFLWRSLINDAALDFYALPQERVDVVLIDRFAEINPDTGIQTTDSFVFDAKKDVYPVSVILDNKDGIQGSCPFYKQRKNVTESIRTPELKPLVSLEEAVNRYGQKLVVVASPKHRFRTLIGEAGDPDLRITDQSYCILERLGRARWQGELQRDLHASFSMEPGKLHYLRRCLEKHGLITMQSHVIRLPTGQQQHSILLLLKRFHILRRSKYDILMESLSNILQDTPGQIASIITLREQLDLHERTFKHVYHYMLSSKLVEQLTMPLEELNPSAGPCITKRGTKITVRCLKLLKPYVKKELAVEEDEDDNDNENEDGVGGSGRGPPLHETIMERDLVLQAYHIVMSSGTKGISQSGLRLRMNIGKLEARMLVRRLERHGVIKGFMVDAGRQRTTKFIGHKSVSASNHMKQFVKEQERLKQLCSAEPPGQDNVLGETSAPSTPKPSSTPRAKNPKKARNVQGGDADHAAERLKGTAGEGGQMTLATTAPATQIKLESSDISVTEPPALASSSAAGTPQEEEGESVLSPGGAPDQSEALDSASDDAQRSIKVVENMPKTKRQGAALERCHETYRLLKRKNMIVEAVRSVKIVEGLFALQKIINDEERQDGVVTKCCKKSILRLIRMLSKEGLVKMFRTTVIQDGVSKKVEFIVHPSVQANDNMVKSAIEQVRFRISGSCAVARMQQEQAKNGTKAGKRTKMEAKDEFTPTTVRGLSRTLGFQPKMHRLRLVHNFLWYAVYGSQQTGSRAADSPEPSELLEDDGTSTSTSVLDQAATPPSPEDGRNSERLNPSDCENTHGAENAATAGGSTTPRSEGVSHSGDEDSADRVGMLQVYMDEVSWKRYVPPLRMHREFGPGWALVSDVVLCLPLSIFVQVTQVNFKIEGLDEYLNDPVKQHYLVRVLPAPMKRQLLFKRKYIFTFYENLQKLVYMGLVQFGPMEKFQDKDQVFVFIKQHANIVDTTSSEPHYWQVTENPEKPFERRHYHFATADDVENYWFDLLCVCLNTPLGLVRGKRYVDKESMPPSLVFPERSRFLKLAHLLKGSREEVDDGSTPGDGRGAGGLDSEFFGHLKRNWLWTNYLLACKKNQNDGELINSKMRLKSLLSKNALRLALKAGDSTKPRCVTTKVRIGKVTETAEMGLEPVSRNQQVMGGRRQRRKRLRKEVVHKAPRKKRKEARTRTPAHDEEDHRAIKRMTRQRVYWSLQEDSMLMLCGVAAKLLNENMLRPFIPYCVVRDMLQAELENSMDKTSVAVGRRTRYILKNPQTLLNHRICLAEAYQDKALMEELERKKPTDPNKPEDCAAAFTEYTRLLRHKFSSSTITCDVTLPNTKSQLFSRYKVFMIGSEQQRPFKDTLSCTEDIHAVVLHNLIQSTLVMSNSQMKSSRSFQTFHMYSLFNQEVLCQVFIQCRKRGLVNRRRVHKAHGPKKNRALPILPMSYQLSQTYYKCFTWRFPSALFSDAFRFVQVLRDNGTGDDREPTAFFNELRSRKCVPPVSGSTAPEGEGPAENGTEDDGGGNPGAPQGAAEDPAGAAPTEADPGDTLGSAEQGGSGQSKEGGDSVEMEDVEGKGEDPGGAAGPQNQPSGAEDSFTINTGASPSRPEEAAQGEQPAVGPAVAPAAGDPPGLSQDVSDMMQLPLDSPGGMCTAALTLMSLGLLSVHVSLPKEVVLVDNAMQKNDVDKRITALEEEDEDDDDTGDVEETKRLKARTQQVSASHTSVLLMKGYCTPGIVQLRNLSTCDNIVVDPCILRFKLRDTPAHHIFNAQDPIPLDLCRSSPSPIPAVLSHSLRLPSLASLAGRGWAKPLTDFWAFSSQDLEACAELRATLDRAGEAGLAEEQLNQDHAHLEEAVGGRTCGLRQYMQALKEECQVVQVGAQAARWVLSEHARPWLLTVSLKPGAAQGFTKGRLRPRWQTRHNIPFMRKRNREVATTMVMMEEEEDEEVQVEVEPPKKRARGVPGATEERHDHAEGEKEAAGEALSVGEGRRPEGGEEGDVTENGLGQQQEEEEEGGRTEKESVSSKVPSPSPSDGGDEEVSYISRPWRMVDGSINRLACKGMLEGLLYHVMARPGLTQQSLVEHYRNTLQPMAVLDLIQALIDMGCVTKRSVVSHKASLFSRSAGPHTDPPAGTGPGAPGTCYYEPTISCCLRMAQVLPHEPHWNQYV